MRDPAASLTELFDAERAARRAHDALVEANPDATLPLLDRATHEALALLASEPEEATLRLVRLASVLGELTGYVVVDRLIDILGADAPEARAAAGEALEGIAFDRFKEVALGVERALERLKSGNAALAELPYVLAQVPEPGVLKLLGRFLASADVDAVAGAIEAVVEAGDPTAVVLLDPLTGDPRRVTLEDDTGIEGEATLGELAAEARSILTGTKA